jgi:uncharacterized protein (DUF608 family)
LDITPCGPLKVNLVRFGGTSHPSSGSNLPPAFTLVYYSTKKMEVTCNPKRRLTYNRLDGAISHKTEFFITTTVKYLKSYPQSHLRSVLIASSHLRLRSTSILTAPGFRNTSLPRVLHVRMFSNSTGHNLQSRVEAGSNTSTVTLRVIGGDEKGSLDLRH